MAWSGEWSLARNILEDDEEEEEEEDPDMEEEMEEENDDDDDAEVINPYEEADPLNLPPPDSDTESEDMAACCSYSDDHEQEAEVFAPVPTGRDVNTLHRQVKGLTQQMFDRATTEHSTLKRLSVIYKYLVEFDTDLRSEIKGQHALRRSVWILDRLSWHNQVIEEQWSCPLRFSGTYTRSDIIMKDHMSHLLLRDAATRNEGNDTTTTSDPQPSQLPGSLHYHL
ncbi:hypothetical protein Tco_0369983 [Tanacetum coccineum]